MNILILGTGNMARGIATRLLDGEHSLALYNADPAQAEALAEELRSATAGRGQVRMAPELSEAVRGSDVVILASWYAVHLETARELGAAFADKIVVDISNPVNEAYDGLVTEGGPSAAENIRGALPDSTKVVKAFNTTFAGTLVDGHVAGQPLDVFIAGDDESAKETVASLVRDGGLNPIDAGGLERARQLESLALLGITLQLRLDLGFATGWKLVTPQDAHQDASQDGPQNALQYA